MLWIKTLHIVFMVTWFAGIFYLPRLMVYHVESSTPEQLAAPTFEIMERRLYRGIMWPTALLTTLFGAWLLSFNFTYYLSAGWMHAKLACVGLLWAYHLYCGHCIKELQQYKKHRSAKFYRILNEIPLLLLIAIVVLVVVKP